MVSYNTDEEQVEALKNWWDENGNQLMIGAAIVLAGVFGFQTWQNSVRETGESASAIYEDMRGAITGQAELSDSQVTTARYLADSLMADYDSSVYAKFAAMQMAKLAVEQGNLDDAERDLQWVLDAGGGSVEPLARLRLARIVLDKGEAERALSLLEKADEGEYISSYGEIRGDIYAQLERPTEARQAYQAALDALGEDGFNPIIQMKLDDIALSTGTPVAAEDVVTEAVEAVEQQAESTSDISNPEK